MHIMRKAIIILVTILVASLFVGNANAMPNKFRNCEQVRHDGVTYLLYRKAAIVTDVPNRRTVTIPRMVRAHGKKYAVRAIWDDTISRRPKIRKLVIHANLETIEDPAIFVTTRIRVVTDLRGIYRWLARNGVRVTYHK